MSRTRVETKDAASFKQQSTQAACHTPHHRGVCTREQGGGRHFLSVYFFSRKVPMDMFH